jgi:uncharacterized protein YjbJ (UPF0337 family)
MQEDEMGERLDEAAGRAKQAVGSLTGNEGMEQEGAAEAESARTERKVGGAVDEASGKIQEGLGKLAGDERTEAEGKVRQVEGEARQKG